MKPFYRFYRFQISFFSLLFVISLAGLLVISVGCSKSAPTETIAPPQGILVYQPMLTWSCEKVTHQRTGFLVKTKNTGLVGVTSAHFLDFDGPALLSVAWLDIASQETVINFDKCLGKPVRQEETDSLDGDTDFVLLTADQTEIDRPVLTLDERIKPEQGEPVWLPNKNEKSATGYTLIEGEVIQATPKYSVIHFKTPFTIASQSGSPVISRKTGKVIGLLARGGAQDGGVTIAIAPSKPILDALTNEKDIYALKDVVGN